MQSAGIIVVVSSQSLLRKERKSNVGVGQHQLQTKKVDASNPHGPYPDLVRMMLFNYTLHSRRLYCTFSLLHFLLRAADSRTIASQAKK